MSPYFNEIESEKNRIKIEYRRRELEIASDLYAPWQLAESYIVFERKITAARLLHKIGKFPFAGDKCLEIGYGKLGWLADLISWGLNETDLYGIELDENRARQAQKALPNADLRIGDASCLPWENETFNLVIASTVFSSILDLNLRKLIANEISRVLMRGGVLLWYDLAIDNPRNPNVKSIRAKELRTLFSEFEINVKRVTLAPPIARFASPISLTFASALNLLPFLRTHLLSVLVKI